MSSDGSANLWRFAPLGLAVAAALALLLAMAIRGGSALWFLALFALLLPAAITAALMRWWPGPPSAEHGMRQRFLVLAGVGLLLAAVLTLLLGISGTGGRLGNMLLVAGALLLPPAALVAGLGWLLGRGSQLEHNLPEGEVVLHRAREHWGVLLPPALVLALAAALLLAPLGVLGTTAAAVLYLLLLPGTGLAALSAYLSTRMAITPSQMLIEKGLFRRRIRRLPLAKIDACGVKQSRFSRLLGYGKITLILDDGSSLILYGVADPHALRQRLRRSQRG